MSRALAFALALGLLASPAGAQDATVFLGGVHARFADSITGTAGVVSARIGASAERAATLVDASVSRFRTGETAVQFGGQGVYAWRMTEAASLGLVGLGSFAAFDGGHRSGMVLAGPALLLGSGRLGGSIRLGAGAVRRIDGGGLPLFTADSRVDAQAARGLTLTLRTAASRADSLRFIDLGAAFALERGIARIESGIGLRAGDLRDNPEWHARLTLRLAPGTLLEASAGAYPRDVSGFTSGGFASVGFRVRLPARTPSSKRAVAVKRIDPATVRVSIAYPNAKAVAIAGEWNAWTPAALAREGSRWIIELGLERGVYRFALLVNGTRWTVPDDVAAVPDDFGGKAALLVIP